MIYSGYLELLTKIFVKKQDAQIYNLYNEMKDNIATNIKSKSDIPIELIENVATAICDIGKQLRFQADKDSYFKYWLAEDTGISKQFQAHLRKLLHPKT